MVIKKFNSWTLNENYNNVKIDTGDDDSSADEYEKLDIIKEFFPFSNVYGDINYQNGTVSLIFDNGKMKIEGKYDGDSQELPCTFTINGTDYQFNFHPWGGLGGHDSGEFKKSIENIYKAENSYTVCLNEEGYAKNIVTFENVSEEEAKKKFKDLDIVLVKGIQMDGKILSKNQISIQNYIKESDNHSTDCRTDIGITVGLIDSIISISRILKDRIENNKEILGAIRDLQDDEDLEYILKYKGDK